MATQSQVPLPVIGGTLTDSFLGGGSISESDLSADEFEDEKDLGLFFPSFLLPLLFALLSSF